MRRINSGKWHQQNTGKLVLSVAADAMCTGEAIQLFELCEQQRLVATWYVAKPAESPLLELIASSSLSHSVGQNWSRSQHLQPFLVPTVLASQLSIEEKSQLVRSGVCGVIGLRKSGRCTLPKMLRLGLWDAADSLRFQHESKLLRRFWQRLRAWQQLRTVSQRVTNRHWLIEACQPQILASLRQAGSLQMRGLIATVTLAELIADVCGFVPQERSVDPKESFMSRFAA